MAYVNNPTVWVGVAMRLANGQLVTYEIDSSHLIDVVIERSVEVVDDWEESMVRGYHVQKPGDYEQVDIHIKGVARRWRDYRDRSPAKEIEPDYRPVLLDISRDETLHPRDADGRFTSRCDD